MVSKCNLSGILLLVFCVACGSGAIVGPELAVNLPQEGATLSDPVVISVVGNGIRGVEFRVDDQLQYMDDAAPFEWTLSPESYGFGEHVLSVRVDTDLGEQRSSVQVRIVPGPPTLMAVEPSHGPVAGGTRITLTGTNLTGDAMVTVGDRLAADVLVSPYETITCTTPAALNAGPTDLVVTTARGSATLVNAFTYDAEDSPPPDDSVFPLSVHSSGRYLVQANGKPFLIHADAGWGAAVQLTHAQIDEYLDDREYKGFNAIIIRMIDHLFSSQTPAWKNAQSGAVPFGTIDSTGSSVDFTDPVESYWVTVDYLVDEAKARGMVVIGCPAYLGFGGGSKSKADQGWDSAVNSAAASDLRAYGAWLAKRFTQGNLIWCMGGDYTPQDVTVQWEIVKGIRSIRTTDLITAHGGRSYEEAYPYWKDEAGFNLNTIYSDGVEYDLAATAYGRSPAIPFFLIEGFYDGESASAADCRRQAYATILSGGCGHVFGNNPVWGFGEPNFCKDYGASSVLSSSLSTAATVQMTYVRQLFEDHEWWKLKPETGTRLVTSGLGSGTSRICPALAGDGSVAMIWKDSSGSVTIDFSVLSPSKVRAQFFDTTDGSYSTVSGSPFSNSGTQSISWPGERVLVLDAGG